MAEPGLELRSETQLTCLPPPQPFAGRGWIMTGSPTPFWLWRKASSMRPGKQGSSWGPASWESGRLELRLGSFTDNRLS